MRFSPLWRATRKRSRANLIFNLLFVFLVGVLVLQLTFNIFYAKIYIVGDSMIPTLTGAKDSSDDGYQPGGDYIYVSKFMKPRRGDIIVIHTRKNGKNLVKRAIAFGGETVELRAGVLYIDGEIIDESAYIGNNTPEYNNFGPLVVPQGDIFFLGDNRDFSNDSRGEYGTLSESSVIGVTPKWAMDLKKQITNWHTFFDFKLPAAFGV